VEEAVLRRALGENFKFKYKVFLACKWEILKVFKANLVVDKLKQKKRRDSYKLMISLAKR
jgi:hypothetical protein